jgi:glycosyltransferase involved in cell wall biosynthesis
LKSMINSSPTISVIIPCFNYVDYVGIAIESVLSQSYERRELIVVDDGSEDGSWEKIQSYGSRLRAIRIENSGAARACLSGVRASTGDFIHFLDADDFLVPNAMDVIVSHLKSDVSKVQFPLAPVDAEGNSLGDPFPALSETVSSNQLVKSINASGTYMTPPTSGNILRRDIFNYIDDITYEKWIDGITLLLAPFIGRVVTLGQPLVCYRVHNRNASSFDTVSEKRFHEEGRRFVARLFHLSEICRKSGLSGWQMPDPTSLAYVNERQLLAQLAVMKRPAYSDVMKFTKAVSREYRSRTTMLALTAWAVSTLLVPSALLPRLAALRADPWSRGIFLRLLKQITMGAKRP